MKEVVYEGPEREGDPSSSFVIDGERFPLGVPVKVSDAVAEELDGDRAEGHNFSVTDAGDDAEDDATESAVELAEANGLDLSTVEGSGAGGRITKGDVEAALNDENSEG